MQRRLRNTVQLIFTATFLFLPVFAQAACSATGYTVVYVNGIFSTKENAQADADKLKFKLGSQFNSQPVNVYSGYNQTHLAWAGDLVETYFPIFDTYDLNTILIQIHPEVTTRKLLVVGHSQGSVYANKMYEYLVVHGEPASALGVYAVATPDSYVAGGGTYLTYELDGVINGARLLKRFNPLPANATFSDILALGGTSPPPPYHSFTETYLATFSNRIVSDINSELGALKPNNAQDTGGCFTPPPQNVAYYAQKILFAVADPTAQAAKVATVATYHGVVFAGTAVVSLAKVGVAVVRAAFGYVTNIFSSNPVAVVEQHPIQNFEVVKKLYGSSLSSQDIQELSGGTNQGAAVTLALSKPKVGVVLGAQTELSVATSIDTVATTTLSVAQATSTAATTTGPKNEANILDPATWGVGGGGPAPSSPPPKVADSTATSTESTATSTATTTPTATATSSVATSTATSTATTISTSTQSTIATSTSTTTTEIASTNATTSATSTVATLPAATSTSATSTLQSATTSVSFVPQAGNTLGDTFDTFNSAGWQSITSPLTGRNFNFSFDDNSDGECFHNGCIVGMASTTDFTAFAPLTYLETNPPLSSGAFTFYGKARRGFIGPIPIIVICNVQSTCLGSTEQIVFLGLIPTDGSWHHYFVAWKQRTSYIESCALTDDTDAAHCSWFDTGIELGTQFDGIRFGSQTGYRNDLGDNLWFDELVPVQ